MGLPSGLLWAPYNVDVTKPYGFALSEFKYGCSFFSWGNVDGHNLTSDDSFAPWSWGDINESAPWYSGQLYGDTPGAALSSAIPLDHDGAAVNLANGWRMPTVAEFAELLTYSIYIDQYGDEIPSSRADKRILMNGVYGVYLKSTINGNRLFFALCGAGTNSDLNDYGVYGFYWTSDYGDARYGITFHVSDRFVRSNVQIARFHGVPIRPVKV